MTIERPITEIIRRRFSCRTYLETPIEPQTLASLADFAAARTQGPLGSACRFAITAASESDRAALKALSTYGTIKSPTGFLLSAVRRAEKDLEDFGYLMEQIILHATVLELGTCWLGGFFNRSSFAKKMDMQTTEIMPAVSSLGYIGSTPGLRDRLIRSNEGAAHRLPWESLFFGESFNTPLAQEEAGAFAVPLEMVRLGPSASNKQPWRIVRQGDRFHFYLKRTPGYNNPGLGLLGIPDLQRVDMGIAMCHFEMSALELGLPGKWELREPEIPLAAGLAEYVISWVS
jgi:hypothetical protein